MVLKPLERVFGKAISPVWLAFIQAPGILKCLEQAWPCSPDRSTGARERSRTWA